MRHLKHGRKLNRNASHRLALRRNLSRALITHERIITTMPKAKDLRPFIEKLITLARKGTLHARRRAIMILGPIAVSGVFDKNDEATGDTVLQKLFNELGPRFKDRPGGYTRIILRHEKRLGDAGATAYIEFLKEGETKPEKKKREPEAVPTPAPALATAPKALEPTPEPTPDAPKADDATPETPAKE